MLKGVQILLSSQRKGRNQERKQNDKWELGVPPNVPRVRLQGGNSAGCAVDHDRGNACYFTICEQSAEMKITIVGKEENRVEAPGGPDKIDSLFLGHDRWGQRWSRCSGGDIEKSARHGNV